jgi:hypothetical protein
MAPRRLVPHTVAGLPKLGWLAVVPRAGGDVTALCGSAVERGDGWLVEGVWDGPFEAGEFHRGEALFGSGLRLDGERVVACASTALVDRLLFFESADRIVVSNSLLILLAATGARLVLEHDYTREFAALMAGIHGPPLPLTVGHPRLDALSQLYHGNLVIDGGGTAVAVRTRRHSFGSYEEYVERLQGTLAELADNAASVARRVPVELFSCVSAGYDSPAVACLAKRIGLGECFTTRPSNEPATARDFEDGAAVARVLGLRSHLLTPPSAAVSEDELYFMVPTTIGSEVALHDAARHLGTRRGASALFTGHLGGKVWGVDNHGGEPADDIRRTTDDGLSLSELRLEKGFFHVALPFLYARSLADLRRISSSPEMSPWRLGRLYDKPIARRILESAGVPRELFGQEKRLIWSAAYDLPYRPELREDFLAWLGARFGAAGVRLRAHRALHALDRSLMERRFRRGEPPPYRGLPPSIRGLALRGHQPRQLMTKWATERLADSLAGRLGAIPAEFRPS